MTHRERLEAAGYEVREYPIGEYYPYSTDRNVLVCDDGHPLGGRVFISPKKPGNSIFTMDELLHAAAEWLCGPDAPTKWDAPR